MKKTTSTTGFHLIVVLIVAALLLANALAVRELDVFGMPLIFALAVLIELLLFLLFLYELAKVFQTPLKILWSLIKSAWNGVRHNDFFLQAENKYPKLARFIGERFEMKKATGLMLTVGVVLGGFFFGLFLGITQDVVFKDPLVRVDQRILNLMPSIRTPEQTVFFSFVTFLANWQSVLLASLLTLFILLRKKQFFTIRLFLGVLIAAEGASFVLKHLIGRMRPERALSLIAEDSFSFPSGHTVAATVIFGFLAYLIIKSLKNIYAKIFVLLGSIFAIVLVGLSRIYLGVHYPSDVLASMALGCFLLTIFITISEFAHARSRSRTEATGAKELLLVPILATLSALFFHSFFIHIREIPLETHPQKLSTLDFSMMTAFPHYSETLTGARMEPISFIYIGNEQQIENLFQKHDWYKADASTLSNTLKAVATGFKNEQYLSGPVTPSYLNAKPQNLAFEQPTDTATFRQRHHTRLWKTDYVTADGREIWAATASLDQGIELSSFYFPTHHIDPNIDAERDYILKSLGLKSAGFVRVVEPQLGKNGAGDEFFTDGKAALTRL